jgi:hypothetical protein
VVSVDRPVNPLHFRRFQKILQRTQALLTAKNVFERLNNFSCVLTRSCGHRRRKVCTVVYFSAIDSIVGDVPPLLSCINKNLINTF